MIRRVARDARAQTRSEDAVRAGRVRVHRLSRRERGDLNGRRARTSRDERVEGLSLFLDTFSQPLRANAFGTSLRANARTREGDSSRERAPEGV